MVKPVIILIIEYFGTREELGVVKGEEKIFHNRETIPALNYEIHKMFDDPFYATQIITPFLNSRI